MAAQYRPYLTAVEIQHLIGILNTNPDDTSRGILIKLLPLQAKITAGLLAPVNNPQSLEDKLGMNDNGNASKARAGTYQKYKAYPGLCSPSEILIAQTYAYENDLMTQEEEAAFEGTLPIRD
jgi:hypothetical protein